MATGGKLEARITVPSGGWDVSIDEGSGAVTVTIPAGEYYLSTAGDGSRSLVAEFENQCNSSASLSHTYSFSISASEAGSGKVTLSADGSFSVTWSNTDLRDVLGFESDGDLASGSSHLSTESARNLWIPDSGAFQNLGGAGSGGIWKGWIESQLRAQESGAGHVYALHGERKRVQSLRWEGVAAARTWIAYESVKNQSMEKFYIDAVLGEAAWSSAPAGPVRWHPDASDNSTHATYKITDLQNFRPERFRGSWVGVYTIEIPRLVEVPA